MIVFSVQFKKKLKSFIGISFTKILLSVIDLSIKNTLKYF